jgi:hypothetical protein
VCPCAILMMYDRAEFNGLPVNQALPMLVHELQRLRTSGAALPPAAVPMFPGGHQPPSMPVGLPLPVAPPQHMGYGQQQLTAPPPPHHLGSAYPQQRPPYDTQSRAWLVRARLPDAVSNGSICVQNIQLHRQAEILACMCLIGRQLDTDSPYPFLLLPLLLHRHQRKSWPPWRHLTLPLSRSPLPLMLHQPRARPQICRPCWPCCLTCSSSNNNNSSNSNSNSFLSKCNSFSSSTCSSNSSSSSSSTNSNNNSNAHSVLRRQQQ